jgi:hypothetical protein
MPLLSFRIFQSPRDHPDHQWMDHLLLPDLSWGAFDFSGGLVMTDFYEIVGKILQENISNDAKLLEIYAAYLKEQEARACGK